VIERLVGNRETVKAEKEPVEGIETGNLRLIMEFD
jgi:hypothetical protein